MVALGKLVVRCRVEGRVGDRVEQYLQPDVWLPALSGEPRDHHRHVVPGAVASYSQLLDPPRHHAARLEGCRIAHLRAEPVHREDDGSPGSDRELAHRPVMPPRAAEDP